MIEKALSPAVALLNRMGYTRKFTLLWLVSLAAVAVVVCSLFVSLYRVIQPSQRELQGLVLIEPISKTAQFIQQHRGLSAALLGGSDAMRERRDAKEREAAEALKAMEAALPPELAANEDFLHIKAGWERLRKEGPHWAFEENFTAHTRLLEQLQLFELFIADEYLLTLDEEFATSYLMDTAINKMPHALEHLGQLRGYGTVILARKQINEFQKARLNGLDAELDAALRELRINIDKTVRYSPAVQESLLAVRDRVAGSARQVAGLVASDILSGRFATPAEAFMDMATAEIDKGYEQTYRVLLPTARTLIEGRIARAETLLLVTVGSAMLLFLLAVYFSVAMYYAIVGSIQSLEHSAHTFAEGDLSARVRLGTQDELSHIGDSFNRMADGFNALLEEHKQNEKSLLESKILFSATFDLAAVGIARVATDGHWLDVNQKLCDIVGYTREELLARTFQDITHPDDLEIDLGYVRKMLARELSTYSMEKRYLRKDGKIVWINLSVALVWRDDGSPDYFISVIEDITERKQHEEQLQRISSELVKANIRVEEERALLAARVAERTAQLQYANRAKDSFLAMMSHEIRTPLGGMLGMMELINLSRLDGEQRKMLQAARDSGRSLLHIVNDILDWSKIEAGKLELAPQAATVPEIIEGVMSTYSPLAGAKGLLLRQRIDSKLGAAHIFDPLRLSQIISNFTSNAIKFTEQGAVEISAELVDRHEGTEQVRFCVKDSGVGISPEQQAHLFQNYEQASAETARMYGGTGLGLAICHNLAELMGGTISVESTAGHGSTFCITVDLPVASPEAQRDVQLRQAREDGSNDIQDISPLVKNGKPVTVLVVDDHPANRMLLKRQLEQLGLQAEDTAYGIVALSLLRAGHFDMVITDCHMPEMDGYELTRSICEMEQLDGRQHVPIIAWTANVLAEEEGRCRAAGMDDMLTKPTELADLKAMLLKWLAKPGRNFSEAPPTGIAPNKAAQIQVPSGTPIDFNVLSKIAASPAAQTGMLQEFVLHNRSDVIHLKNALKEGNPADVARSAHRVKGASRMVGALELAGICEAIEKAAARGDMSGAQVVAGTALDEAIERIEAAISAFIAAQ